MLDRISHRESFGHLYGNLLRDSYHGLAHLPRTVLTNPKQSVRFIGSVLAVMLLLMLLGAIGALAFHFESPAEQRHDIQCPVDGYGDRDC